MRKKKEKVVKIISNKLISDKQLLADNNITFTKLCII